RIPEIRARTSLPVAVGFGIRDAQTAATIGRFADAVIVGSRLIEEIEQSPAENACQRVATLLADIRRGLDTVTSSARENT
ncbi:MAG TPA: tryptophan synthase subunit alpha, partial [Accumulibacter sp.]|nr:tryptophan synthase subunit alpha [Accumulibacter sp.]